MDVIIAALSQNNQAIKSFGTERSSDQGRLSPIKILDPGRKRMYVTTPCSSCMMACMPSVTIPLHGWMIVPCTAAVLLKINFARLQGGFVQTPRTPPGYGPAQHNLATSRSQMCVGAKPPYAMESTTLTGRSTVLPIHLVKSLYIRLKHWTETWEYKVNENVHNADALEDKFGCLRHYLVSVVRVCSAHDKPRQRSGHFAKAVNFKSNLTGYHYTFPSSGRTYNTIALVQCFKMSVKRGSPFTQEHGDLRSLYSWETGDRGPHFSMTLEMHSTCN